MQDEVDRWGATVVNATAPLTLIDLRTTGLIRLGVSTEAARGKAQAQGRRLSQAVYDQTDADGLIYLSRLTGQTCVCGIGSDLTLCLRLRPRIAEPVGRHGGGQGDTAGRIRQCPAAPQRGPDRFAMTPAVSVCGYADPGCDAASAKRGVILVALMPQWGGLPDRAEAGGGGSPTPR